LGKLDTDVDVPGLPDRRCVHCGYHVTVAALICPNCGLSPIGDRPRNYVTVRGFLSVATVFVPIAITFVARSLGYLRTGGALSLFLLLSPIVFWLLWYIPLRINLAVHRYGLSKIAARTPSLKAISARIETMLEKITESRRELRNIIEKSDDPTENFSRVKSYAMRADQSLEDLRTKYRIESFRIKLRRWENDVAGAFGRLSRQESGPISTEEDLLMLQRRGEALGDELSNFGGSGTDDIAEQLRERQKSVEEAYEAVMISRIDKAVANVSPLARLETANLIAAIAAPNELPPSDIEARVTQLEHELDRISAENELSP